MTRKGNSGRPTAALAGALFSRVAVSTGLEWAVDRGAIGRCFGDCAVDGDADELGGDVDLTYTALRAEHPENNQKQ